MELILWEKSAFSLALFFFSQVAANRTILNNNRAMMIMIRQGFIHIFIAQ
jgi:hypothetical protein